MAIDLASLLSGNNLDTLYRNDDPYYQAARGIAGIQTTAPRSNTEAFLLPFLQNTLAGGLAGYGKENARQTQYQDISSMLGSMGYQPSSAKDPYAMAAEAGSIANLLGSDDISSSMYGQAVAPEGFSGKIGMADLLLATSQKQAEQEAAAKYQELQDKLNIESSQPYLEMIRKQEEAKASGKSSGERVIGGLTTDQQLKLETDITTKLSTGNEAQKVLETQAKAKQVLEALKKDDPIRAATAIYGFAKLLDPEGVVRKEDGTIVANPGGPAGQLASYYNTLKQEGQLTEQTKQAMKEVIPSLVQSQYESYDSLKKTLVGSAVKQGAREEMIGSLPPLSFEPNVPPGYKLQRNSRTGETRMVKQ
jgi:hypothetical protein